MSDRTSSSYARFRSVGGEPIHDLRAGRQTGQRKTQPAGQHPAVGLGAGFNPLGLERRQDKCVDLVAQPLGRLHRRRRQGWKSAAGSTRRAARDTPLPNLCPPSSARPRPSPAADRDAASHPFDQQRNFCVRQLAAGGHLQIGIVVADRRDQSAFLRRAGTSTGPLSPPCLPPRARIERQPAFDLGLVRMALAAALDQHGLDLGLEEAIVGLVRRRAAGRQQRRRQPQAQQPRGTGAVDFMADPMALAWRIGSFWSAGAGKRGGPFPPGCGARPRL